MVKKIIISFLMIIVLITMVGVYGCAPEQPEQLVANEENESDEKDDKVDLEGKIIVITTHPVGTLGYTMGNALAQTITKHTPMRAVVEPTPGPKSWLPLMERGEIHFGLASDLDITAAITGDELFYDRTYPDIRIAMQSYQSLRLTMLVRDDSPIKTMSDMKGKTVSALCPGQPSIEMSARAAIASAGINQDEIVWISADDMATACRDIIEGRADGATIPLGAALVEELEAAWGARFISIDMSEEGLKRAREFLATAGGIMVDPGPTGVKEPTAFLAYQYNLVAPEQLPDEIVYEVVRVLNEHFDEYQDAHPRMADFGTPLCDLLPAPVHPGAIKYYEKEGIWTENIIERHEEILKIVSDK